MNLICIVRDFFSENETFSVGINPQTRQCRPTQNVYLTDENWAMALYYLHSS